MLWQSMLHSIRHPPALNNWFGKVCLKDWLGPFTYKYQLGVFSDHHFTCRSPVIDAIGMKYNPMEYRCLRCFARIFRTCDNQLSDFVGHLTCKQALVEFVANVCSYCVIGEGIKNTLFEISRVREFCTIILNKCSGWDDSRFIRGGWIANETSSWNIEKKTIGNLDQV